MNVKNLIKTGKNRNLFNKVFEIISYSNKKNAYDVFSNVITDLLNDPYTQKTTIDLIRGATEINRLTNTELMYIYKVIYMKYNSYVQRYATGKRLSLNQLKDWFLK